MEICKYYKKVSEFFKSSIQNAKNDMAEADKITNIRSVH